MISRFTPPRRFAPMFFAFGMLACASHSNAAAVFTFANTSDGLDGFGIGASQTVTDTVALVVVTLTTVDIIGQDGTLATEGIANKTNITSTALGINSVDNGTYGNSEPTNFNPNEAWIFSSNVTINLAEIVFESFGSSTLAAQITISSSAFTSIVLNGDGTESVFSLGSVEVPAGTSVKIQMTNSASEDTAVRIASFTVAAVPEPSSAILSLLGSSLLLLRRRH